MTLIESPYGKLEVHFSRNNVCILVTPSGGFVTINGVQYTLRKEFATIDNDWNMVEISGRSEYYKNSMINLRFHDWQRNGSPSSSAYTKMQQWIEAFFLADLNRGVYTKQMNEAERRYRMLQIKEKQLKIKEANDLIAKLTTELLTDNALLNALPE